MRERGSELDTKAVVWYNNLYFYHLFCVETRGIYKFHWKVGSGIKYSVFPPQFLLLPRDFFWFRLFDVTYGLVLQQ